MKSIEKISNEIYDLRAKYLKVIETSEQNIADAEKDISECEEGMKQAINNGDFATYEKLSAKRTFSEGRKAMFETALSQFKQSDYLSSDEFYKYRTEIINAAIEAADQRAKKMAELTDQIYSLGMAQDADNKEIRQLLDALRSMTSINDVTGVPMEGMNTWRWGLQVINHTTYKQITEKYPDKRKKSF